MHALIIGDQFIIASLIEDLLRDLGYRSFEVARSEQAAIEAAENQCPDLITADHRLSAGSGIKAVLEICEKRPIPVVFIVGDSTAVVQALPEAVVVNKPFRDHELTSAVGEALVRARRKTS
jgi:CheY-like chemotaxis protein